MTKRRTGAVSEIIERPSQQVMVEPRDAGGEARPPVGLRARSVGEPHRIGMDPRADDQAGARCHAPIRLAADRDEVPQLRRQERIVPPAHQQHRRPDGMGAPRIVDILPIRIGVLVRHPVVEELHLADGAIVSLDQRKSVEAAFQNPVVRIDVDRPAAARRPEQCGFQRECAAYVEHLAEAGAGDLDHQRAWPRRALVGQHPLGMTEGRAAPHAEAAVEPWLAREPWSVSRPSRRSWRNG